MHQVTKYIPFKLPQKLLGYSIEWFSSLLWIEELVRKPFKTNEEFLNNVHANLTLLVATFFNKRIENSSTDRINAWIFMAIMYKSNYVEENFGNKYILFFTLIFIFLWSVRPHQFSCLFP